MKWSGSSLSASWVWKLRPGWPAKRLQKGREIAALAQLLNVQADGACARIPLPRPEAVTLVLAVRAALAMSGAAYGGHLDVHQPLRGILGQLAQEIASSLFAITPGRSIMVSIIVLYFVVVGLNNL